MFSRTEQTKSANVSDHNLRMEKINNFMCSNVQKSCINCHLKNILQGQWEKSAAIFQNLFQVHGNTVYTVETVCTILARLKD